MPNLPWTHSTLMQLTIIGAADTAQIVNTHHFEASGAAESTLTSDAAAQTWCAAVVDDWLSSAKAAWLACHANDYVINLVKGQVLERPGNFRHKLSPTERPLTSANVGTGSAGGEVTQVSGNIKWRSTLAGKRHRGRTYIGPLSPNWYASGALSAAGITVLTAYSTVMIGRYTGSGSEADVSPMTIYSRPYNSGEYQYTKRVGGNITIVIPPDYAGDSTFVTAGLIDPYLRTQRRRELGVGA